MKYTFFMGVITMKPLEFLMAVCNASENDNIYYKPYVYGNLVQSIPMRKAVEMVEKDIEEMKEFFIPYHLEDKAEEATYNIWKNHLVVF